MEEKEPLTIEQIINRLKSINKDELRERDFFQEVISVIGDMKDVELTEEDFEKFSATLQEIGCTDYNSWLSKRRSYDVDVEKRRIKDEIAIGEISGAERMIDNLLSDYNRAINSLRMMNDKSQGESWVEQWLKNSKNPLNIQKRKSDFEFEFHEEGEFAQRQSGKKQQEIEDRSVEIALLKAEINAVQEEIDELRAKEAELIGSRDKKQEEFESLEEK